jgi:hypothetical protein
MEPESIFSLERKNTSAIYQWLEEGSSRAGFSETEYSRTGATALEDEFSPRYIMMITANW